LLSTEAFFLCYQLLNWLDVFEIPASAASKTLQLTGRGHKIVYLLDQES
jgi:hypothetical protein